MGMNYNLAGDLVPEDPTPPGPIKDGAAFIQRIFEIMDANPGMGFSRAEHQAYMEAHPDKSSDA